MYWHKTVIDDIVKPTIDQLLKSPRVTMKSYAKNTIHFLPFIYNNNVYIIMRSNDDLNYVFYHNNDIYNLYSVEELYINFQNKDKMLYDKIQQILNGEIKPPKKRKTKVKIDVKTNDNKTKKSIKKKSTSTKKSTTSTKRVVRKKKEA